MGRCDLTAVLFCKGRGADANAYQPGRDESQWWSRRDALVRCVSSYLFGPSPNVCDKELIFLFDDDAARMNMKVERTCAFVPTEQKIVSLWKQAAQKLNETVQCEGLTCCIRFNPSHAVSRGGGSSIPSGLDSKRQILEFLQKQCSIDFLRKKGLNSNPDVILRKANKKRLLEVWSDWVASKKNDGQSSESSSTVTETFFQDVLSCHQSENVDDNTHLVAGTLHEDCEEFPCFDMDNKESVESNKQMRLVLFLGAVRDMTSKENFILKKTCQGLKIPLVGIRFGSVPEFTSKILSVLSFHHSQHAIITPIQRLLDGQRTDCQHETERSQSALHFVCTVPTSAASISTELNTRDRIHWCLVRIIVCSLWRSRMVSTNKNMVHTNSLHLVFDDGVVVHLYEDQFVSRLASQHQAAPCEYQILAALKEEIRTSAVPKSDWKKKRLAKKVIRTVIDKAPFPISCAIGIEMESTNQTMEGFYTKPSESRSEECSALILMNLRAAWNQPCNQKMYQAFLSAATKQKIKVFQRSVLSDACHDLEAATITMLQQFCYQQRLFLPSDVPKDSKRKYESIS